MNQGRIWCVVNPTVGLPLFLGGVAAISLIVHTSVMTNTTWVAKFFQGKAPAAAAMNSTAPVATMLPGKPGFAVSVAPAASSKGETSFVVTVVPTEDAKLDQVAAAPLE